MVLALFPLSLSHAIPFVAVPCNYGLLSPYGDEKFDQRNGSTRQGFYRHHHHQLPCCCRLKFSHMHRITVGSSRKLASRHSSAYIQILNSLLPQLPLESERKCSLPSEQFSLKEIFSRMRLSGLSDVGISLQHTNRQIQTIVRSEQYRRGACSSPDAPVYSPGTHSPRG